MTFDEFKRKIKKAYEGYDISFSTNGVQHMAQVGNNLTLYTNAHSDAIYGMMNGNFIGRCPGVEKYE